MDWKQDVSKEKESGSGQVQGKAWKAKRNCKATKAAEETVSMLVAKSMSSLFLLEMGWSGRGEAVNKKKSQDFHLVTKMILGQQVF